MRKTDSRFMLSCFHGIKEKVFCTKLLLAHEKWVLYDNLKRRKLWINPKELLTSVVKKYIAKKFCYIYDRIIHYELLSFEIITVKLSRSINEFTSS